MVYLPGSKKCKAFGCFYAMAKKWKGSTGISEQEFVEIKDYLDAVINWWRKIMGPTVRTMWGIVASPTCAVDRQ